MFIVILALAQAFVPNMDLARSSIRFLLGIPLGSDIANGYTYIMESHAQAGEREVMGNRWQFVFAVGQVITLAVVAVFIVAEPAGTT